MLAGWHTVSASPLSPFLPARSPSDEPSAGLLMSSEIAIRISGCRNPTASLAMAACAQTNLREAVVQRLRKPFARQQQETFWALKDIYLEIKRGEVVGVIGRNGAGKSTLLKILSRITEPTTGRIELYGRVGSLLEVGTGFHPELTGRENIYLNGAILGMRKSEINRQFDAIVDFAGVEKISRHTGEAFIAVGCTCDWPLPSPHT